MLVSARYMNVTSPGSNSQFLASGQPLRRTALHHIIASFYFFHMMEQLEDQNLEQHLLPTLPVEVVNVVASFAGTPAELHLVRAICSTWREAVREDLWHQLVLKTYPRVGQLLGIGEQRPMHVAWEQIFREQRSAQRAKVRLSTPPLSAYYFTFELSILPDLPEDGPPVQYMQTVQLEATGDLEDNYSFDANTPLWTAAATYPFMRAVHLHSQLSLDVYVTRDMHTVCVYQLGRLDVVQDDTALCFDMQENRPPWHAFDDWPQELPVTRPIELQPNLQYNQDEDSCTWQVWFTADEAGWDGPPHNTSRPTLQNALRFLEYVTTRRQ